MERWKGKWDTRFIGVWTRRPGQSPPGFSANAVRGARGKDSNLPHCPMQQLRRCHTHCIPARMPPKITVDRLHAALRQAEQIHAGVWQLLLIARSSYRSTLPPSCPVIPVTPAIPAITCHHLCKPCSRFYSAAHDAPCHTCTPGAAKRMPFVSSSRHVLARHADPGRQ